MADGDWALAVLNRSGQPQDWRIDWSEQLQDGANQRDAQLANTSYRIEDSWTGAAAGTTARALAGRLEPRDTAVFRLRRR